MVIRPSKNYHTRPDIVNIGHEIRTPLNAIVGFSSVLGDSSFSEESKKKILKMIQNNTVSLLSMIEQIQELMQLDTNNIVFNWQQVDINALCIETISKLQMLTSNKQTILFKPPCSSFYLETDESYLHKLLSQLLSNAIKFSTHNPIIVSYEVRRKFVRFYISNNGPEIPRSKYKLIFNRGIKLNPDQHGLGLGLAISKEIIKRLGGRIFIDRTYRTGCRVIFTHPIHYNAGSISAIAT